MTGGTGALPLTVGMGPLPITPLAGRPSVASDYGDAATWHTDLQAPGMTHFGAPRNYYPKPAYDDHVNVTALRAHQETPPLTRCATPLHQNSPASDYADGDTSAVDHQAPLTHGGAPLTHHNTSRHQLFFTQQSSALVSPGAPTGYSVPSSNYAVASSSSTNHQAPLTPVGAPKGVFDSASGRTDAATAKKHQGASDKHFSTANVCHPNSSRPAYLGAMTDGHTIPHEIARGKYVAPPISYDPDTIPGDRGFGVSWYPGPDRGDRSTAAAHSYNPPAANGACPGTMRGFRCGDASGTAAAPGGLDTYLGAHFGRLSLNCPIAPASPREVACSNQPPESPGTPPLQPPGVVAYRSDPLTSGWMTAAATTEPNAGAVSLYMRLIS